MRSKTPGFLPGVFVCALVALVWSGQALGQDCAPTAELEQVRVAAVVDGDTLRLVDGRRVRLIGINAPEAGRDGGTAEPLAQTARAAIEAQLGAQRQLWLQPGIESHDRYGRLLAHGFAAPTGASVAAALLQAGLAVQVVVPPNLALADCFKTAERMARRAQIGVWAEQYFAARPAYRLTTRDAGFRRVTGTVRQVDESRHTWWLELDGPLVIRLDKRDLGYFGALDPTRWKGRKMGVRGWISDRSARVQDGRKPMVMPLRHPVMLEMPLAP